MSELLQAALDYAEAGLRVHPCRPEDKRPLTRWSTHATTKEYQIRMWWTRWPDALIAVCTGGGLVVVDIDPRNGGELDSDDLDTRTASTRSGGWHHWYMTNERVGNAVGLLPGVDVRGEGGYVIAPPSPGWSWLNDNPILPLPAEIIKAMERRGQAGGKRSGPGFEPPPGGTIGPGMRHDYMVRFAGWAIRILEPSSAHELAYLCREEYLRACSPADAPARNIDRIAHSIWRQDQRA